MTLSLEYPDYGPGRSGNGTVSIASGFGAPNRRFESSGVVSLPIPSQDITTNVVVRRVMLHLPEFSPPWSNDHCPTIAVGLGMFQAHRVPVRDAPFSRPSMAARRPERAIMPNSHTPTADCPTTSVLRAMALCPPVRTRDPRSTVSVITPDGRHTRACTAVGKPGAGMPPYWVPAPFQSVLEL